VIEIMFDKENIVSIQIIRITGPDKIYFNFVGPTPFPNVSKLNKAAVLPTLYQDCQKGYAEEWLSRIGFSGESVELITEKGTSIITIP
jgi:hypothetical protein